jgi:plastocyanin
MRKLAAAAVSIGALSVSSVAVAREAATPTLKGTVGPGFTITLTSAGKKVVKLKAGTYLFAIADRGAIHNFVLEKEKGGTFEKTITSVPFTGTKSVKIKLTAGEWKYYCRPHESAMFGSFKVV